MHKLFLLLCLLGLIVPAACGQPQPPALINPAGSAAAPPADPVVDQALDALNARGKDLQDFTGDVSLQETDSSIASDKTKLGKIWYQRKPSGDVRIRVSFDRKKVSEHVFKQRVEWKLADGKLIDQNFDTKLQVTRQVVKPGQKLDPLKLGEGGQFPLPIGQPREDVLKNFIVKKVAPTKDDPAGTIHLTLTPLPDTRMAKKFSVIDVFVGKDNFPVRIETVDKDGTTVHTTDLSNIKINTGLKDADFTLPEPGKDWGVRDEGLPD